MKNIKFYFNKCTVLIFSICFITNYTLANTYSNITPNGINFNDFFKENPGNKVIISTKETPYQLENNDQYSGIYNADSSAEGAILSVEDIDFITNIVAGSSYKKEAKKNLLEIYKGEFKKSLQGGHSVESYVEYNSLIIEDGTFNTQPDTTFLLLTGAAAEHGYSKNNLINIKGGTYNSLDPRQPYLILGGEGALEASNNKATITGGTFNSTSYIVGGASLLFEEAKNNIVAITGKPNFKGYTFFAGGVGRISSNNTLILAADQTINVSNISNGSIPNPTNLSENIVIPQSFQNYYFAVSSKDTIVNINNTDSSYKVNLSNATIGIIAKSGSILDIGDQITLISKAEATEFTSLSKDDTLKNINALGILEIGPLSNEYDFDLKIDGDALVAIVTGYTPKPTVPEINKTKSLGKYSDITKAIDNAFNEGAFNENIYDKMLASGSQTVNDIKPQETQVVLENVMNTSSIVNSMIEDRIETLLSTNSNNITTFTNKKYLPIYAQHSNIFHGKNGGENLNNKKVWGRLMYNYSKRSSSNDNPGFKSDTKGFAVGIDTEITDDFILGLGYAYDDTDIKSGHRDTDVHSHTIFAYSNYNINDNWFIRGNAGYSFAKYKENVSNIGNKAKYDVNSILANTSFGYKFKNGLTPSAGLRYAFVDKKTYTDEANQKIKTKDSNVVRAVAGVDWSKKIKTNKFEWTPNVGAGVSYDINNTKSSTIVNVGSSSYRVEGKRLKRTGFEARAGATTSYKNWDFSLSYELNAREKFQSHTGMLKATYNF